jgi:hypothetical protein
MPPKIEKSCLSSFALPRTDFIATNVRDVLYRPSKIAEECKTIAKYSSSQNSDKVNKIDDWFSCLILFLTQPDHVRPLCNAHGYLLPQNAMPNTNHTSYININIHKPLPLYPLILPSLTTPTLTPSSPVIHPGIFSPSITPASTNSLIPANICWP